LLGRRGSKTGFVRGVNSKGESSRSGQANRQHRFLLFTSQLSPATKQEPVLTVDTGAAFLSPGDQQPDLCPHPSSPGSTRSPWQHTPTGEVTPRAVAFPVSMTRVCCIQEGIQGVCFTQTSNRQQLADLQLSFPESASSLSQMPFPQPWVGSACTSSLPIWSTASSSGLPTSRKMRSYWRESSGGL